jgi:hypothetical protein
VPGTFPITSRLLVNPSVYQCLSAAANETVPARFDSCEHPPRTTIAARSQDPLPLNRLTSIRAGSANAGLLRASSVRIDAPHISDTSEADTATSVPPPCGHGSSRRCSTPQKFTAGPASCACKTSTTWSNAKERTRGVPLLCDTPLRRFGWDARTVSCRGVHYCPCWRGYCHRSTSAGLSWFA